jgi:hypothetical protein
MERYQNDLNLELLQMRIKILTRFLQEEFNYYYDCSDTDPNYAIWVKETILAEIDSLKTRCLRYLDTIYKT